jgi:hypothetical protein
VSIHRARARSREADVPLLGGVCHGGAEKFARPVSVTKTSSLSRLFKPKAQRLSHSWIETLEALDRFGRLVPKAVAVRCIFLRRRRRIGQGRLCDSERRLRRPRVLHAIRGAPCSSSPRRCTEYWSSCGRIAQSIDQRNTQKSQTKLASPNFYQT